MGDRLKRSACMYDDVRDPGRWPDIYSNERRYADHAATMVRTWFLDPATKMNPHMRYGQAVPGLSEGRGSGIIDTRHFIRVLDAVALLKETGAWSDEDQAALAAWMKQYLEWLQHDPQGEDERNGHNNHGTWYDAQVATIAMFVGEREVARKDRRIAKENRIGRCIEPDGSQPEELARTKGLHYCVFNLSAIQRSGSNRRARRCRSVELYDRRRPQHSPWFGLRDAVFARRESVAARTDQRVLGFAERHGAVFHGGPSLSGSQLLSRSLDLEPSQAGRKSNTPGCYSRRIEGLQICSHASALASKME